MLHGYQWHYCLSTFRTGYYILYYRSNLPMPSNVSLFLALRLHSRLAVLLASSCCLQAWRSVLLVLVVLVWLSQSVS